MRSESKILTKEQITAIKKAQSIGKTLAANNPEIADLYKENVPQLEIAIEYIPEEIGISEKVASMAIGYALKMLIEKEELRKISSGHLSIAGQKGGKKAAKTNAKQGTGIYGLTDEQREEIGRKSGLKNYSGGVGIYGMTKKERREALEESLLAQGKTLFSREEKRTLVELVSDPAYQHPLGTKQPGKPNYQKIQEEMFREFGLKRTIPALRTIHWRMNKTPPASQYSERKTLLRV